jgi:hypothetical protein
MLTEKSPKSPKVAKMFHCETCEYICSKQSDFNKHCSTRKHIELTKLTGPIKEINTYHVCSHCDKKYTSRVGLWKHYKICKPAEKENISMVILDDDVENLPIQKYIMKLVEQNNELKNMFIQQNTELMQQKNEFIQHNTELKEIKTILAEQPPQQIINNNTNNIQNNKITNNQFNLNVFLQQTCKDAINMSDFIDSLEINTKSLERTGTHGYVHGISKIFMDGIRKLKVQERPIHCTDLKREVLYIKDNDTWTKDTEDNKQFKKALATVVHRNMIQIVKWEEENPETSNPESKNYDFYFELARQSMGGGDQDVTDRNNEKILKAIAQEVHIDKKVKELL